MKFRPCIDIHNGKVKQIVGGSLLDKGDYAKDNFVSEKDGDFYAGLYKDAGLKGGHIILLNPAGSQYYEEDVRQSCLALSAYPGGLHISVTSYVFKDGKINYENLKKIAAVTGKEHLVLDLSCRKKGEDYYIVTDRWQKFTDVKLTENVLSELAEYCDEFLVHAVDVEGKTGGIEEDIAALLGNWDGIPVTYAGGVSSFEDLRKLKELGKNKVDVTIGSALDLFGGKMPFSKVLEEIKY